MPKHFFTSDLHFGHGNIMKYSRRTEWLNPEEKSLLEKGDQSFKVSRDSVERMNHGLADEINKLVGPDDVLWHLGDFCFGQGNHYLQSAHDYRKLINCQNIYCCWGNHDEEGDEKHAGLEQVFPNIRDVWQVKISDNGSFAKGNNAHRAKLGGLCFNLFLFHYCCAIWNGSHKDVIHTYGHSHSSAEKAVDQAMPGHRSFDVGVDNAFKILGEYRPFTLQEILKISAQKPGWTMDHHKPRT